MKANRLFEVAPGARLSNSTSLAHLQLRIKIFALLTGLGLALVIPFLPVRLIVDPPDMLSATYLCAISLLLAVIALGISFLFYRRVIFPVGKPWDWHKLWQGYGLAGSLLVTGVVLRTGFTLATNLANQGEASRSVITVTLSGREGWNVALYFAGFQLIRTLCVAVGEELFFRGFVQTSLALIFLPSLLRLHTTSPKTGEASTNLHPGIADASQRHNQDRVIFSLADYEFTSSVVIASLIFALFHLPQLLYNPPLFVLTQVLAAFGLGLFYGAAYRRSGNIWGAVYIHWAWDFLYYLALS